MEHLKGVDGEGGIKALELLATRTIEILAREPLRIYQKPHRDVSPVQELIEWMKARKAGQEPGKTEENGDK